MFVARTHAGVRVAVTGAGVSGVFRAPALEAALDADFCAEALAGLAIDPAELLADLNGSAAYRANLVMVMARRALEQRGCATSFK